MTERSMGQSAAAGGTFAIGGDLTVNRLGFGAMRITGKGIWGEPADPDEARAVLRRAVELGVNLIDTAGSYGPDVSERLIGETLAPYPEDMVMPRRPAWFARVRGSGIPTAAPSTFARRSKAA